MNTMSDKEKRLLLKNNFTEYPPVNISKNEMTVIIALFSSVVGKQYDKINEWLGVEQEALKINDPLERKRFIKQSFRKERLYELTLDQFFSFFRKDAELTNHAKLKQEREVRDITKSLEGKYITLPLEGGGHTSVSLFELIQFDPYKNRVRVMFTDIAHEILFEFKKDFTKLAYTSFKPSSKYSWGMYLFLRRKLHDGKKIYSEIEELDKFKKRFGLERVPSFNKFYDLKRRILSVVEKDCKTSNDITVKFEGIKTGRKVTKIKYTIRSVRKLNTKHSKLENLSVFTQRAYQFLTQKDVYPSLALEMVRHKKLRLEPIQGFEDVFFALLWKYYNQKANEKNNVAVFCSWWKKGTLMDDVVFYGIIEQLSSLKKKMSSNELNLRYQYKSSTKEEFDQAQKQRNDKPNIDISPSPKENKGMTSISDIMPDISKLKPK